MGASSERTQGGENRNFNSPEHDDRDGAALEAPAHRDRDAAISLREANSSRAVRSPMSLHPPFCTPTCTFCVAGELLGAAAPTTHWSRFNRQDGHQQPGAAAPCCRGSNPACPAASSRRSWPPPPPPPPSSRWMPCFAAGVCQLRPVSPPLACCHLLRNLLGRAAEEGARVPVARC